METLIVVLLIITAYMLGSIPTSVWIGKHFYNIDIREYGSGNAGATNTFRVLGKIPGIIVLLIDIFKGSAAVSQAYLFSNYYSTNQFIDIEIGLAISAVVGHLFPLFAAFRGGKGVATLLGATLIITPVSCGLALVVFLFTLLSSKIVSLSSMLGGIVYPIILAFIFHNQQPSLRIYSILIAVLLIITHRKNIRRLIKGQESKLTFSPKSN